MFSKPSGRSTVRPLIRLAALPIKLNAFNYSGLTAARRITTSNLKLQTSNMSAYIIVEVTIHDPETYKDYMQLTPAAIAAYDGKFIVRGGKTESLEGDWNPQRIVVLEFPSVERAKQWWNSEEYAPAKKIRQATSSTKMIVVEGYEGKL